MLYAETAIAVLIGGGVSAFAAAESDATGMTGADGTVMHEMVLDVDDMAYYRRGRTIVKHIVAGNHASAERGILRLRKLRQPQAEVLADVHIAIGMAYGESGHFDAGIAHLEQALDLEHDLWPGVAAESRAYLVYLHAAAGRFEMAHRLLGSSAPRRTCRRGSLRSWHPCTRALGTMIARLRMWKKRYGSVASQAPWRLLARGTSGRTR